MDQDELAIEEKKLNISRSQLALEQRKERNTSIRYFVGVILLGIATLSVNSIISSDRSRRELVAGERQLVLPYLVGLEKLDYDDQIGRLDLFQKSSLSPEMQNFLDIIRGVVEKHHQASLAAIAAIAARQKEEAQARAAAEEVARRKAAEAAAAAEQERVRAEADRKRQYEDLKRLIGGTMNDHP
jgi:hypothetical protein